MNGNGNRDIRLAKIKDFLTFMRECREKGQELWQSLTRDEKVALAEYYAREEKMKEKGGEL